MMTPEIRFLLDRALSGLDALRAHERATLYEGVAQIVDGAEGESAGMAEEARKMAFANRNLALQERRVANQQTEFLSTLFS